MQCMDPMHVLKDEIDVQIRKIIHYFFEQFSKVIRRKSKWR